MITRTQPTPRPVTLAETEIHTWMERDRMHVHLTDVRTGHTIAEWWDDDVTGLVDDGFLNPHDWHGSAFRYASELGMLPTVTDPPSRSVTVRSRRVPCDNGSDALALILWGMSSSHPTRALVRPRGSNAPFVRETYWP